MKALWKTMVCLVILLNLSMHAVAVQNIPGIVSEAYVVMDANSGQVLFENNADERMFPASITKIFTCALALEKGEVNKTVTVSSEAVFSLPRGTTHIALDEGEIISVNDLLGAAMVESANDAANALAEYVSGTQENFARLMNEKARELGAQNSNFVNSSGLHDPAHVTSAYDMALITKWALRIDGFRKLFGAEEWAIPPTNKQKEIRKFGTHHHMLVTSKFFYEGTIGGKLGWTPEAKHTLVTVARRNGVELICVVLKTDDQYDKYRDAAALLDAGFAEYRSVIFDKAYFQRDPIPLYDNGACVGEIEIIPEDISFLRPSTIAKADIKIDILTPEKYEIGSMTPPEVVFKKTDGGILYKTTLNIKQRHISDNPAVGLLVTTKQIETPKYQTTTAKLKPWMLFSVAFFFLVTAILFSIRAYNLAMRQKRLAANKERINAFGTDAKKRRKM